MTAPAVADSDLPLAVPRVFSRANLVLFCTPPVIYLIAYFALTFPLVLSFRTHFFCDAGDGLQNVWNLWWVNEAITTLHQSPWFTNYLEHPHGSTLIGHTMNPVNGFLAIPLLRIFSLTVTHNLIILLAFVGSGTTAFWLARYVTKSFWPAVVAGYVYTFSAYHWAHGVGHMQLTTMQWLPLFVLAWIVLLEKPSIAIALLAAGAFLLVELTDFYYLLYCVMIGVILFIAEGIGRRKPLFFVERRMLIALGVFIAAACVTSGPLVFKLIRSNSADPFFGFHPPSLFSTDLYGPFVPGAFWKWGSVTKGYWSRFPGNVNEASVSLGIATLLLAVIALVRFRLSPAKVWRWLAVALIFFIISLGPGLQINCKTIAETGMPYAWLQTIIPPLKLSGCPSRMMAMTLLATSLLAASGLTVLATFPKTVSRTLAALLVLLIVLESIPPTPPLADAKTPDFAVKLRDMPPGGVVFFTRTLNPSEQLFTQIAHRKPMAFGYISRMPTSVVEKNNEILDAISRNDWRFIVQEKNIRYLITDGEENISDGIVYAAPGRRIYDLTRFVR